MELTGPNESLYKGFLEALLCSVLIVLITFVVPEYADAATSSDRLMLLPRVGPFLALGLLLRWRSSRKVAVAVFLLLMPLLGFEAFTLQAPFWGCGLIFLLDIVLLYLLLSRRDLRLYLRE